MTWVPSVRIDTRNPSQQVYCSAVDVIGHVWLLQLHPNYPYLQLENQCDFSPQNKQFVPEAGKR